jgi:isochorismate hydrolase
MSIRWDAFGHDTLMELLKTKRIKNLLVDAVLFHLPCLFHPITFSISFLNA